MVIIGPVRFALSALPFSRKHAESVIPAITPSGFLAYPGIL